MKIKVRFFAASREITGKNETELELPEGATVSGLLETLKSQFKALKDMQISVAVNTEYAKNDHTLHNGDDVALIPPVSGG